MNKLFQIIASFSGGIITFIFGAWSPILTLLVCIAALDYITGVISAAFQKTLSSKQGFKGILKKIFMFLMVAFAALLDKLFPISNQAICSAVCIFYIANEALSILENAGEIGIPLPSILKNAVEKLKDR